MSASPEYYSGRASGLRHAIALMDAKLQFPSTRRRTAAKFAETLRRDLAAIIQEEQELHAPAAPNAPAIEAAS